MSALNANSQFGDTTKHRGHTARVIEVCRHPGYPAITVQWDTEEMRDGKAKTFRNQETIKFPSLLKPISP